MRRAAKKDANHNIIVDVFEKMGCSVGDLSRVGDGFPDICVGFSGFNFLVEIKDGDKPKSQRKLRPNQKRFHTEWKGSVFVAETVDDAISLMNTWRAMI